MCVQSCVSDGEQRINEEFNLSSTHWGVNHPSRAGVLPNMSSGDVVVGSDYTEEYVNLLCRFHLSFLFFGFRVAPLSSSVVIARFWRAWRSLYGTKYVPYSSLAQFCHLSIILFEFFGIPSSRNCAFVEVFESISSCFGFHPDSVGSLAVGGEFSLLRVFLVSP